MLFQYQYPLGGERLTGVFQYLQGWGVQDFFLPFLLFFALFFGILQTIKIFKKPKVENNQPVPDQFVGDKRMNGIIAMGLSFLLTAGHVLGYYPPQSDPVLILFQILPNSIILMLAILLALTMVGFVAKDPKAIAPFDLLLGVVGVALLLLTVVQAIYPAVLPSWTYLDPNSQAVAIVLLVMVLVIWFVTREKPKTKMADVLKTYVGKKLEEVT